MRKSTLDWNSKSNRQVPGCSDAGAHGEAGADGVAPSGGEPSAAGGTAPFPADGRRSCGRKSMRQGMSLRRRRRAAPTCSAGKRRSVRRSMPSVRSSGSKWSRSATMRRCENRRFKPASCFGRGTSLPAPRPDGSSGGCWSMTPSLAQCTTLGYGRSLPLVCAKGSFKQPQFFPLPVGISAQCKSRGAHKKMILIPAHRYANWPAIPDRCVFMS